MMTEAILKYLEMVPTATAQEIADHRNWHEVMTFGVLRSMVNRGEIVERGGLYSLK